MATTVTVHGLKETTDRLRNLPKELSGKNGGPIRKALFQAAKVIEEDARSRALLIDDPATPTAIADAIRKWRERNPRSYPGSPTEIYHIGVDTRNSKKRGIKAWHWHFLEFGTVKQPAKPYLRPAAESKWQEAVARFAEVLKKDVDRLEKKVAARSGR